MSLWTQFRDNILIPLNPVAVWTYKHLLKKPSPLSPNYAQQTSPQMFKAEITSQKIIYGQMRTSGPLYRVGATGANHMYSHIIIPLAGHELDSIGNIYVNTKLIAGSATLPSNPTPAQQWRYDQDVLSLKQYANHIRIKRHTGAAGQVVDPDLLAELDAWKSTNVGNGIAYLYVRFKFSVALFPNGIENVQADVRGAKVFDPRTGVTAWSDNWALCVRDYLTADYGMGLTSAEVNDAFTIASADISQQVIPTANAGSQNRYTLNGVIDTKNKVTDNIKKMLTAGAGHIVPVIEGQCRIIAGAYPAAGDITVTVTESDIVSDIDYQPHSPRNSLFNAVTGSYSGEESGWKKLTYPQVGDAAAVLADGRIIRKVIDLPYSTDHERCQRLSKLVLNQHRASAVLKISCKATVKEIAVMEVINVQLPALWANTKTFRVMDFTNNPDFTVDLVLHEDNADIYTWNQSDAAVFVPIPPQVINVGATIVQPGIPARVNGLELNGQGNNTEFTGGDAHFVWRHTTAYDFQNIGSEVFGAGSGGFDAWFMGYEVTVKTSTGTVLRTDFTKDNFYDFTFLKNAYSAGGPYRAFQIEVRIKGQQNQLSLPAKLSVSNPAPAVPSGLSLTPSFDNVHVTFINPTDLDFVGVEVYMSTTQGFTPDATTLKHTGNSNDIAIVGLTSGVNYYFKLRGYDQFGLSGTLFSTELLAKTTQVVGSNITPGSLDYILFTPAITSNIQAVPGISAVANTAQATANTAAGAVVTAQATANTAIVTADAATITAGTAVTTANSAATTATGAQSTADAATITAGTAVTDASGAQATASTALTATNIINGHLAASYAVRLNVNGHVTGFGLTDGSGADSSQFTVISDSFRLVSPTNVVSAPAFTVDASGNAEFIGNLKAAGGTFSGVLSGGSIGIGNGTFTVDATGNMVSTSGTFTGAITATSLTISPGVTIPHTTITGLGGLATQSTVTIGQVTGLGSLAALNIVGGANIDTAAVGTLTIAGNAISYRWVGTTSVSIPARLRPNGTTLLILGKGTVYAAQSTATFYSYMYLDGVQIDSTIIGGGMFQLYFSGSNAALVAINDNLAHSITMTGFSSNQSMTVLEIMR